MPATEPLVSVVVPVYRNAATVAELCRRLAAAMGARRWELLFVNDACPEGSLESLRMLTVAEPRVGVLALARNGGQNAAVLAGLEQCRGDCAVVMDADLQDPPEAISDLLRPLAAGEADVVFGGRRGEYEGLWRRLTGRGFKWTLRRLSGGRLPADAGLFVALSGEAVATLLRMRTPEPYIVGMLAVTRLRMLSVPVSRPPRSVGTSAYSARARLRLAWRALLLVRRLRRAATADGPPPTPAVAERLGWAAHPKGAC